MKVKVKRTERRTNPTLTLSGLGSARKAQVTPRMGSFGAGSTFFHHEDMDREPCTAELELMIRLVIACPERHRSEIDDVVMRGLRLPELNSGEVSWCLVLLTVKLKR